MQLPHRFRAGAATILAALLAVLMVATGVYLILVKCPSLNFAACFGSAATPADGQHEQPRQPR